jgi:flagellar hook-basal body complex protein FliE
MRIDPIMKNLFEGAPSAVMPKGPDATGQASFADELKSKVSEVNQLQNDADAAMQRSSIKGATDIHENMIKLEQANMSLLLLAKVRNKALDAYNTVMHMTF